MRRSARLLATVLLMALWTVGCVNGSRWQVTRRPDVLDAAAVLASDSFGLDRIERPEEVPIVPVRKRLRPCCGFGSALRVRLGAMRIPGVLIDNIRSPDDLGRHTYDAGQSAQDQLVGRERNGLVYTCHGGFIDVAHVRDYADWTLYLATQFGRRLETGGTIELPPGEGGKRRFVLEPIDPDLVAIVGRRELAAALAVRAGFQLSIWHEIATWYGWSSFSAFPERASAFSPEDLYSNLLGAKLTGAIVTSGNDLSEQLFNQAVDAWLAQALDFLGAVPAEVGEQAMAAVDGLWWDSNARLPDANLVLRRSFETGLQIEPWLVPEDRLTPKLDEALGATCGEQRQAHVLRNPSRLPSLSFDEVVRLEIELGAALGARPELEAWAGTITHTDFPELIEQIRREAQEEFGEQVDRP